MITLLASVLAASLLGSVHCAGMCGGIVAFSTGSGNSVPRRLPIVHPSRAVPHAAYHGGRLLSYTALGAGAGALGSVLNLAGSLTGLADVAALLAGTTLVLWALATLLPRRWWPHWTDTSGEGRSWFSRALGRVVAWPPALRSLVLGVSTGLLPCGWLYAFVVSAAGTASPVRGALVLTAFWAGSVPVLLGVGSVAQWLRSRLGPKLPAFSAVLLVGIGATNLWMRAHAPVSLDSTQAVISSDGQAVGDGSPSCPHHSH